MKKSLIFTLLIALVSCQHAPRHYYAYRKMGPVLISYRVSEAITAEQREQFNLFHGIENFKSAVFYRLSDGGYEVEIITEDQKFVSLNRDNNAIMITRDYINRYEEIGEDIEAFEEKWEIIDYDALGFAITRSELKFYNSEIIVDQKRWVVGCVMGALLGGAVFGIFTAATFEQEPQWPDLSGVAVLAGTVVGCAVGGLIGIMIGLAPKTAPISARAVEAIKEARKPKIVESYE